MTHATRRLVGLAALVLSFGAAQAIPVGNANGVRIYQHDFVTATTTLMNIDTGTAQVDLIRLRHSTGMASGYINIATAQGWVVRNLVVPPEEVFPYARVSANFNLGVISGTPLSALNAVIDYAATPSATFSGGTLASQAVEPMTINVGGAGEAEVSGPPNAPNQNSYPYASGPAATDLIVQMDHPNIEAAQNQCFPASVANSLQYLKNRYGLAVPHVHKPGLRGDDSLVGQIDEAMNRQVTSRRVGQGIGNGGLKGKLNYLAKNKLKSRIQVTHWGKSFDTDGGTNMSSDTIDGVTVNSTGSGAKVNMDAVFRAMAEGQNCEMIYTWSHQRADGTTARGGHAVDLVGGSSLMGRRSISWASDRDQSSDRRGAGFRGFENMHADGPDANGEYTLGATDNMKVRLVICEKYVQPPYTETVTETIDPRGHKCCVNPPPPMVNVVINNGAMTVSGNGGTSTASWLPLKGTISNGLFDLNSTGLVAGFANVTSRFTGSYANGLFEGSLSVGNKGELFGVPITYKLRIAEGTASAIMPAMRINGFRQAIEVQAGDLVKPSVSMGAGPFIGKSGDWFVVLGLAGGGFMHFDLATMSWQDGILPTYTGPLFELPFFGLPVIENLPAGTHSFYFGFDTKPNGELDFDAVVYEKTDVTVTP